MIGIVVVSHSHALGTAAVELAAEMVDESTRPVVEVAAGLDEHTFGTDAAAVAEAIGRADSPDGVLVLLDLGSAVLSAEMALEFVDSDLASRTRLSSAPLVEGLVAAVVTAAAGADLDTVAAEARRGLSAKADHVGDGGTGPGAAGGQEEPVEAAPVGEEQHLRVTVDIEHGLHARPAARLVATVNRHPDAVVRITDLDTAKGPADARSLSAVATLGVLQGHDVEFLASGPQASAVLAALSELADEGFGDRPVERADATTDGAAAGERVDPEDRAGPEEVSPRRRTRALGLGLGAAMGPAIRRRTTPDLSAYRGTGDPGEEAERLRRAMDTARADLRALVRRTRAGGGDGEAGIFEAHLALLDDPSLVEPVTRVLRTGRAATAAWHDEVSRVAADFAGLADPYQRDRAEDVRSVMHRVERALLGMPEEDPDATGILVVDELDPATAATLDTTLCQGVVTIAGGATGHGVIVLRARGVPVLTGAGQRADVETGTLVALDERTRRLLVDPDPQERADFEALLVQRADTRREHQARAGEPATTSDGHTVVVKANVTDPEEAAEAVGQGAEGSGLVRTEVVFGAWTTPPTVEEQVRALTDIAVAMDGRPITVRSWDIGADKPLPYLRQEPEANPFLGVRGVRSFRRDPALLLDQLEAVCRVAREHAVRLMFPMVATVEEVEWSLARLEEAAVRAGGGRPEGLEVGIMVEVPAAALRAEAMTVQLDFVSIGTNDLTQYTLAAERGSAALAGLTDPLDPAVLRLVHTVCTEVAEGVRVAVCGDAASDPAAAALLIGLGVEELSATAATVPDVKARLRESSLTDLQDLAGRALRCESAEEVRALLG
jgi:multiphosphoryl transfer protein